MQWGKGGGGMKRETSDLQVSFSILLTQCFVIVYDYEAGDVKYLPIMDKALGSITGTT